MNKELNIPILDFKHSRFVDRMTILLGASGSGKSVVICDILHSIKDHVEQIIVVSPTDRQNHTYDKGIVPLPCIHYTITEDLLTNIWERQNALVTTYTRANEPSVLRSLFNKISGNNEYRKIIDDINAKLINRAAEIRRDISDPEVAKAKISEMETDGGKLILAVFKKSISENKAALSKMRLSVEEVYTLKYYDLNPRLALIFDDCTDLISKFKKHPVVQKLFFQGRWAFITCLIACHTDIALDPGLKKNAFITIFTEETSAHAYFERKTNDLTKEQKLKANNACKIAFTELSRHQKLAWLRDESKFYVFTSKIHNNFIFGNQYVWDFCTAIKAEAGAISANNKFIGDFG